ncbi:hypothetical protein ED208_02135 [Stagnimonas aquatica]|uniref:histidine kinase n=1 Tax=Stagnimonas aquatica TaxID=2689987 RepID=A0A3N0VKP9_9GAMM|nr:hypothetical protein ED208_02135 [Stagnimonas aquatica]
MLGSLRARLLAGLLGGLLLAALLVAALLYRITLREANEVFDQHLRDTALSLRDQMFAGPFAPQPELSAQDRAADLAVQVFSLDGVRVYLSQPHSVLPGLTTLGYSDVETREGRWRVYGVRTPLHVIQVAQPTAVREERAARLALRVLAVFALLVPLLAALIWGIVGRGLRPLRALAAQVEARPAEALEPLPQTGLPSEAQPLVQALNGQLRRLAGLLESERAFLADAAHELRTPLTALRLQVQALQGAPEAERAAAGTAILAGIDRASRLIEQLLALARQEQLPAPEPRTIALHELPPAAIADLLPLADAKQIELGYGVAQPCTLLGDAEALSLALRNLIDNAIRYTPVGGRVELGVQCVDGQPELWVSDSGPGIPEAERERVLRRFYRLPGSPAEGSGLGLALVSRIAQRHGAQLCLDQGALGGLRVRLRFR